MEEETIKSMESLGFISRFIFEHLEEDRLRYNSYKEDEFVRNFRVDDILFEKFVDYALANNISMDFYQFDQRIKLYLKSALAEQLFSENLSAKIRGEIDPMLQKVMELDAPTWQPDTPPAKD